jgi:CRISPR-associated protein Csd2
MQMKKLQQQKPQDIDSPSDTPEAICPIANRYEFLLIFDCEDGNPNGDPDSANMPRTDPQTSHGLVTDVCLKWHVRNYVQRRGEKIFIQRATNLNRSILEAHENTGGRAAKPTKSKVGKTAAWMCQKFFDVRTFGALMTTGVNAGKVQGPVQISFGRSIDPVLPLEVSITRGAIAQDVPKAKTAADYLKWEEDEHHVEELRTMGRKMLLPYGLYVARGFISAFDAQVTGFSKADLLLLLEALMNMFDHSRSSSKGFMSTRRLIVFKHIGTDSNPRQRAEEAILGRTPAHRLLDLGKVVSIELKDKTRVPRQFSDYSLTVELSKVPKGIALLDLEMWDSDEIPASWWED